MKLIISFTLFVNLSFALTHKELEQAVRDKTIISLEGIVSRERDQVTLQLSKGSTSVLLILNERDQKKIKNRAMKLQGRVFKIRDRFTLLVKKTSNLDL